MVVRREQPWKALTKILSKRFSTIIGMRLSNSDHALTVPIIITPYRKCLIAATQTKWDLSNIDVAIADKYGVSLSHASPVFAFPVQKSILTDGLTSYPDD